ncbi:MULTISPECIES: C1 family peptidase [unclassified Nostoc]|uniref:C1 family peptidase n=1 Tax=unclassified Nostoc TaxID=2593658 RepID=UPI001DE8EC48|nr:C1 family peptidase [Nostoc sp. JL23]MBN3880135.1 cysteine protease [Nostoc sp. JL23]
MNVTHEQQIQQKGTGWVADPVDERDKVNLIDTSAGLPTSVDLREWCSPIENQGKINSCTAHAAITLVEYFQKRAFGKYLDASRLFLYKVTRNLLHYQEDKGANARTTMKALALFGVPPEEYWPYDETKLYDEPPAFCYALASEYKALEYYRIDAKDITRDVVLQQIKANLAANRPLMFGAILHTGCLKQAMTTGKIPVPSDSDTNWVGHTMATVGYDDSIKIQNTDPTGIETTGAFLIQNSWGTAWGDSGYGWLPYEYVLRPLSNDWWTLLKQDWLKTGEFDAKE